MRVCVRACMYACVRHFDVWTVVGGALRPHMSSLCSVWTRLSEMWHQLVGIFDITLNASAFKMIGNVITSPEHAVSLGLCAVSLLKHDSL